MFPNGSRALAAPPLSPPGTIPAQEARQFRYSPSLDGLRGISILLVMGFHYGIPGFRGGFIGVDIFFVLSGFLITVLLLDEQHRTAKVNIGAFYARRARRLLPALFALLAALWVASLCLVEIDREKLRLGSLLALSYVTNVAESHLGFSEPLLSHTWSLALEEQFYLIWPLVLSALLRLGMGPRLIGGALGLGVVLVALHRGLLWVHGASWGRIYVAPDTRCDALLLGCIAACMYRTGRGQGPARTWLRLQAAVASLCLLSVVVYPGSWKLPLFPLGLFTLVAFCGAVLVLALVTNTFPLASRLLARGVLVKTGRLSYGLYLWHYPILLLLPQTRLGVAVGLLLSFVAAEISWRAIEARFLARR